jgi:3-oxoadipate enol-lactonase
MASMTVHGYRLNYVDRGQGIPVVLGHGLCMDNTMFAEQMEQLAQHYRVIAPDWRGHGGSEARAEEYSMEDQAEDLYELLGALGTGPAHIGGMSMGGMIALRFALAHPEMTRSLILIDTDAGPEAPERASSYEALAGAFLSGQAEAVVDPVMQILFAPPFFTDLPVEARRWRNRIVQQPGVGLFHATRCVTRRTDLRGDLGRIKAPVLIICGEEDVATTPDKSRFMAEAIAGAKLALVPKAGHSSPVEQPARVTQLIASFLGQVELR